MENEEEREEGRRRRRKNRRRRSLRSGLVKRFYIFPQGKLNDLEDCSLVEEVFKTNDGFL